MYSNIYKQNLLCNRCNGCLTEGHNFSPLPEVYVTLYYNLINESLSQKALPQLKICLCTECCDMLKMIKEFQDKIFIAHVQCHGYFITQLKNENLKYNEVLYENEDDNINEGNINNACNKNNNNLVKEVNVLNEQTTHKHNTNEHTTHEHTTNEENILKEDKNKALIVVQKNSNIKKKSQNHLEIFDPIKDISKFYSKLKIDNANELKGIIESDKTNQIYLKRRFKCEFCLKGFNNIIHLDTHKNNVHYDLDNQQHSCNICRISFTTKPDLEKHMKTHNYIHKCNLCNFTCVRRWMIKNHIKNSHCKLYYCKLCQHSFSVCTDFIDHYKSLHTHLVCDYCGRRFLKKTSIQSHIRRNHTPPECTACGLTYRTYHSLDNHNRRVHPPPAPARDTAYCVECDKHFSSDYSYKNHLRTGVRHVAPQRLRVSCPECDKVFSRRTYMNNHYRLAHAHTSKHHCGACDKYFVTAFSLRQHKQLVHDKIALPRNKLCKLCGKAFSTNRTLSYHLRSHTGVRPFLCDYCPSSFSQKKSMTSHLKTEHSVPEQLTVILHNNLP